MQGGNDVDYPDVISTSYQRSRCTVIGRPAGCVLRTSLWCMECTLHEYDSHNLGCGHYVRLRFCGWQF